MNNGLDQRMLGLMAFVSIVALTVVSLLQKLFFGR